MEAMTKELELTYQAQSSIKREGDFIIIPSFMSYADAASAITNYEEQMEEVDTKAIEFRGHADDMLVALQRGMVSSFGFALGNTVRSFFGTIPGSVAVAVDYDQTISVPYGRIEIPGLPIMFKVGVNTSSSNPMNSKMVVQAECKRKFMPLVDKIEKAVRDELAHNSIFKGKAINSKFEFINVNGFDLSKIVHSQQEGMDIEANILMLIRDTEKAREARLNLKRTILLHGQYGTGKTLTALKVAKVSRSHGWTFLNVMPGDNDISAALNFAKKYQPCVVFFEDIDQVTDGERNTAVNEILNTIDGILSKNAEVITILTTNHVEKVERAMLRPGRIDAVIELGRIDAPALRSIISTTCKSHLEEFDEAELMESVQGYTPAFVVEGCQRAVLYAMAKGHQEITQDDLKFAFCGLRSQYNMMLSERDVKKDTLTESMLHVVKKAVNDVQASNNSDDDEDN
jgi:AAA+ superfamily predicted ATPase